MTWVDELAEPGMEIGFRVKYLVDAIDSAPGEITMYFGEPDTSTLVVSGKWKAIVMPMRL